MFEREYRDLAYVPRWAIARTTRTQSVAEHSFYVTLYASFILDFVELSAAKHGHNVTPLIRASVLQYALKHDRSEAYMSDIPGPVKRSIKDDDRLRTYELTMDLKVYGDTLSPHDATKTIVKAADLMEEFAFMMDEKRMGNEMANHLLLHISKRLEAAIGKLFWLDETDKEDLLNLFVRQTQREKILPENNDDVASKG